MVRRGLIIVAAAVVAALSSCSSPDLLMSAVKKEVTSSLGMYLQVTTESPAKNAANVSPNVVLLIDFDRPLDVSTVVPANITIIPSASAGDPSKAVTWTYAYDAALKRLSLTPVALEGGTSYLVTMGTGIRSATGEPLGEAYAWSFTTAALPGGTILINSGAKYTRVAGVTLYITPNLLADQYYFSEDSAKLHPVTEAFYAMPGPPRTAPLTLSGQGTHTVYYQFKSASSGALSDVFSTSIIFDNVPPNPPILTAPSSPSASHYPAWSWTTGGNSGFGVFKYYISGAWSDETTLTSYSATAGLADGSYTFYVEERDEALNWSNLSSASLTIAAPPNKPTVSATSPTIDTTPTWSWSTGGFGNGNFQYQLDSTAGSWTATSATSYTSAALGDGSHTLYVQESDGTEWSAAGSASVVISEVIPYPNQLVDMTPLFQWRPPLALKGVTFTYSVQIFGKESWTNLATGLTRNYYQVPPAASLPGLSTITYRVVAVSSLGATIYIPSSSGTAFRTSKAR
jgi:hypothetical protein